MEYDYVILMWIIAGCKSGTDGNYGSVDGYVK